MSESVIERLSRVYQGDGFRFAYPADSTVEHDVLDAVVLTDRAEPVLIAVAVEDSPVANRNLQVPGLLGLLLRKYEAKGDYEQLWYGRVPVDGSDAAEAAEIRYGTGDPRQALIVAARIAGRRIVTLQVHFPPSTADENRPLALGILDSLTITNSAPPGTTDDRWTVVDPGAAFPPDPPS
jgi:hypothetical protein